MRTSDIARRARRSLLNAKARTILTSLAIAVGAFTIAVSLAVGEGTRQYADQLISSNINERALFIVADKSFFEGPTQTSLKVYDPSATTTQTGASVKQLDQSDVDALSNRSDLESVTPIYNIAARYVYFGDSDVKFSADLASYDSTIVNQVSSGRVPTVGEQLGDDEALIPESYANVLVEEGVIENTADAVGMKVTLVVSQPAEAVSAEEIAAAFASGGQSAAQALLAGTDKELTYTVIGLAKQPDMAFTSTEAIQISTNQARAIAEYTTEGTDAYQKYLGVVALAVEGEDPADVKAAIKEQGYVAQTAEDLQEAIFTIVNTMQGIVLGFGIIALIASIFGIINTQYISVLERTREIGLMKALGMRGRSVSRLFQFEAAWIGLLGGAIGVGIAVGAGTALNPWITETLSLGEGNYLLVFQPIPIVIMMLALVIIAMVAGWFPARKAAHLDPIEALRTE